MPSMRSDRVFALVDGNNFYVSCERAFNPRLEGRPVIVYDKQFAGFRQPPVGISAVGDAAEVLVR
mgnify:CR=1 FL=1